MFINHKETNMNFRWKVETVTINKDTKLRADPVLQAQSVCNGVATEWKDVETVEVEKEEEENKDE